MRVARNLSLTGPTSDQIAPSAPTNVVATAVGRNVALSWAAATDNIGVAVHTLTRLDDVAHAKTFAVTLETEAGSATPTSPMILAGPAL